MAPRKRSFCANVSESFRIEAEARLKSFMRDHSNQIYEFPTTLSNVERAWVHNYAKTKYQVTTKSHGKDTDNSRRLLVYKPSHKNKNLANMRQYSLNLNSDTVQQLLLFFQNLPQSVEQGRNQRRTHQVDASDNKLGIGYGSPQLPAFSVNAEIYKARMQLPIWIFRSNIMENIISNQVTIIVGETGSGKTTQLPQFILDYSASCQEKCRIVCTQPRRISALSVAERVALERGEHPGQTVGYHIRLESCVSPKTSLIYCTNGILLRTLMSGDNCMDSFTHVIVDEIHERDRFSDFLLICLRECLINYPNLRLILMSATMDYESFKRYFNNAPVMVIPGRNYTVREYFLEDILPMIKYEPRGDTSGHWKKNKFPIPTPAPLQQIRKKSPPTTDLSEELVVEMTDVIFECVAKGSEEDFSNLLQLILSENVPVNFQHPITGISPLMAAAIQGKTEMCAELVKFGADLDLTSWTVEKTALDWASSNGHRDCHNLLQHCKDEMSSSLHVPQLEDYTVEAKALTDQYNRSVPDQNVDFHLLHDLLYYIYSQKAMGGILVFLTGYEDIVSMKDRIFYDKRFDKTKYTLVTLHSMMQMSEQSAVFANVKDKRKIVLSTNIAETSVTIEDIVYVVDAGKCKEKSYDSITGICSLQANWISQAAAKQRSGRAGRTRPGECYRLYSKVRFQNMTQFATAEILRMPLHELCLQTKKLAPSFIKIAEFLKLALEPPSDLAVTNAIKHLQEINALDEEENLTQLGHHLVDMPVEPRLAKMLIYSVIFKCVDPLLTIVAFLSLREPFTLPTLQEDKIAAAKKRKAFSEGTFSDHMTLLKVFDAWQDAKIHRQERSFCAENYVSCGTMDMVILIRSQLLAQLRASGFVKTKPPGDIRDLNVNAKSWPMIKAVLTAGLFPNVACIDKALFQIRTKNEQKIVVHQSSVLRYSDQNSDVKLNINRIPTDFLIYEEIIRNTAYMIKSITCVSSLTIALFAENSAPLEWIQDAPSDSEISSEKYLVLNKWIAFKSELIILKAIQEIRRRLDNMIHRKVSHPYRQLTQDDEHILHFVVNVLFKEDTYSHMKQPEGIGHRPKIMTSGTDLTRQARHRVQKNILNAHQVPREFYFARINVPYNKYVSPVLSGETASPSKDTTIILQSNHPTPSGYHYTKNEVVNTTYPQYTEHDINRLLTPDEFSNIDTNISNIWDPKFQNLNKIWTNDSSSQSNSGDIATGGSYLQQPERTPPGFDLSFFTEECANTQQLIEAITRVNMRVASTRTSTVTCQQMVPDQQQVERQTRATTFNPAANVFYPRGTAPEASVTEDPAFAMLKAISRPAMEQLNQQGDLGLSAADRTQAGQSLQDREDHSVSFRRARDTSFSWNRQTFGNSRDILE